MVEVLAADRYTVPVYYCACKNTIMAYARITILVQTHVRLRGRRQTERAELLSVYENEENKKETLLRILKISNYPPISCR